MPSKKKKYNARFPAGRIKKIMQSDEEIGKVAQAVPVIISRTLELFVESLLTKTLKITNSRNAKTLSPSHMKQCIMSEQRFDFLRELVKNIPDISVAEEAANYNEEDGQTSPEENYPDSDTPFDLSMPSTSTQATRNALGRERSLNQNGNQNSTPPNQQVPGCDLQRTYLKRSEMDANRVNLRLGTTATSNSNPPPMHTASIGKVNVDCLPPKLLRSESTPAAAPSQIMPQQTWLSLHNNHPRQRLKHQSQLLHYNPTTTTTATSMSTSCKTLKQQQKLEEPPHPITQTAMPAPIVSFDFCNKPVIKIDYSNLQIPVAAPLSAPATLNAAQTNAGVSAFNYGVEPIINIDLSNIVASPTNRPAMATISIGAPTTATRGVPASCSAINSGSGSGSGSGSSSKPPMIMAVPLKCSNAANMHAASTSTNASNKSSGTFELDEDYDNI